MVVFIYPSYLESSNYRGPSVIDKRHYFTQMSVVSIS